MAYLLLTFALWTQPQGEFCLLAAKEMAVGYVFSRAMSAAAVVTFPCAKNSGLAHSFSSAAQKDRVRIISILFALVCACLLCADSSGAGCGDSGRLFDGVLVLSSYGDEAVRRRHR